MGVTGRISDGTNEYMLASTCYGTCGTAASMVAKVANIYESDGTTLQSFTLMTGITVHIKFTYSNTASSPTLNVNGTGAKNIYKYGSTVPGTSATASWQAGSIISFTYDGTYWMMNDNLDVSSFLTSSDVATVATSGSYNDLSDKPTIPTVNNATLTIQKNGTNVKTFTANASSNVTANITVPTATSDLTNDSGFITSLSGAVLTSADGTQTVNVSGDNNSCINIQSSTYDLSKSSNGVTATRYIGMYMKDKNGTNAGKMALGLATDGSVNLELYAHNRKSTSSADTIGPSIILSQPKSTIMGGVKVTSYLEVTGDSIAVGPNLNCGMTGSTQNLGFWADSIYPGSADYRVHLTANYNTTWAWVPETSGKLALGTSGKKWTVVYANNGTIQTSDRTKKKDIDYGLENFDNFYKELKPVSYKFIDGTSGRTHIGFIAQDVEESLENNDLTALDFAGFCKDQKSKDVLDDNGVVVGTEPIEGEYDYSLRYDEFVALNTRMIQKLMDRVDELEATITSQNRRIIQLEAKIDKLS